MREKSFMKKLGALFVAGALAFTGLPQFATEVHAAELPDNTQFATVEQLKTFNTNDRDGAKNPAKVYFGNNDQQWWIAGSQNDDSIVLFAVNPLQQNSQFEPDYESNKAYDTAWNCTYTNSMIPEAVYPNHYGASPLRETMRKIENENFTVKEQALMNESTIYTEDDLNNAIYSVTEKLYLGYGIYTDWTDEKGVIIVGENNEDNLTEGLRVGADYWTEDFWLRTPHPNDTYHCLVNTTSYQWKYVANAQTRYLLKLTPAFELDTSSIVFGSLVPAVTTSGKIENKEAFTLRYEADDLGSAFVPIDKDEVQLTNVPQGTYLVVQDSETAYAKQITNETTVSAEDMGLNSFANCKVWLEKTDTENRITYATLAEEEQPISVSITGNTGLSISNNAIQEVNPNEAITDITVEVADGYYLPEGYINGIQGLNGLNATLNNEGNGFTISGTPTSNVNITLPEATAMPKAPTPTFTVLQTATSITVNITNYEEKYGEVKYKLDNGNWQTSNTFSDLDANTSYNIYVKYEGAGIYLASDEATQQVTTTKHQNAWTKNLSITGWEYGSYDKTKNTPTATAQYGTDSIKYLYSAKKDSEYTENVPTDVGTYYVKAIIAETTTYTGLESDPVEFTIVQATNEWEEELAIKGWGYDEEANTPTATAKYGTAIFTYSKDKNGQYTEDVPTEAGTWYVKATVAGTTNYTELETVKEFTIAQAKNEWTEELTIKGWISGQYDKKENAPTAFAKFGEVIFTYSKTKDGEYTSAVPQEAGTWYVKATVAETENYTGLETVKEFTVSEKLNPQIPDKGNIGNSNSMHTAAQTGDTANFTLLSVFVLLSCFGIVETLVIRRRKVNK